MGLYHSVLLESWFTHSSPLIVTRKKVSEEEPHRWGRVYVSIYVLPVLFPYAVMYRFNTVLISIRLSLLHPVVSHDNAKPEIAGIFQVLKAWACFRADWGDRWPSCCWWQVKLVMGTPVTLPMWGTWKGSWRDHIQLQARGKGMAFIAVVLFALGCGWPTKGLAFATACLEGWRTDTVDVVWSSFLTKRFGRRN